MTKNIAILGSTGSIGTQTLDVIRKMENVCVKALSTNSNIDLLLEQINEFKPEIVAITDEKAYRKMQGLNVSGKTKVVFGMEGLIHVATYDSVHTVVNSVVGSVGLVPTVMAIKAKKDIALANKETLVSAGELIMNLVEAYGVKLYPLDSEHSAIFQCLQGNLHNKIEKIYLTASGGAFRNYSEKDLAEVTVANALKHPNWVMGKKITIDSATLMNKGLEFIEAKWLFGLDTNQIKVLVHPQSIIHSMVEFQDGAVLAQLGEPDMRVPIQYALSYPLRQKNNYPKLDFLIRNTLTFEEPREEVFKCLQIAKYSIEIGGTMPAVMNKANEIAVDLFLKEEIKFLEIPSLIKKIMDAYTVKHNYTLDDILEAERFALCYQ